MHLRTGPDRKGRALRRPLPIAAALVALSIIAAACGGSPSASVANLGSSSTTTTAQGTNGGSSEGSSGGGTTSGNSGPSQATIGMGGVTVQFSQCMQKHGVPNFPDPNAQGQVTMNGVDPQSPSFQAAQSACAKYAPRPPSAAQQQRAIAGALKFSKCMRSHGISDFPDPNVHSGAGGVSISIRIGGGKSSDLNPNNPLFQAAQKACQSVAPFGKGLPSAQKS